MAFKNPWGKGSGQFNRWMKNNPWEEGGEFFKNAISEALPEFNNAVVDIHHITLTQNFKNSRVYLVYSKLLENSVFQKFLDPFKKSNLMFDYEVLDIVYGKSAETDSADPENISITINGNANHYVEENDPGPPARIFIKKPADMYVAKTLIHECIHAYITVTGNNYPWKGAPGPVQEHNYMATEYRDDIVKGLTEFANENNVVTSAEDIDAIAWAGLDSTTAFSQLSATEQLAIDTRFRLFYSQTYWFEFGLVQQDDMSKYGGNLPTSEQAAAQAHIPR